MSTPLAVTPTLEQSTVPSPARHRRAAQAFAPIVRATLLLSVLAVLVLALTGVSGRHRDMAAAASAPLPPVAITKLGSAADVLAAVNAERSRAGLLILQTDDVLQGGAQQWAEQLAVSGSVSHDPQLTSAYGDIWTRMGENLGMAPTLDEIHSATLRTKSQRDTILNAKATVIGIGVANGPSGVVLVERIVS